MLLEAGLLAAVNVTKAIGTQVKKGVSEAKVVAGKEAKDLKENIKGNIAGVVLSVLRPERENDGSEKQEQPENLQEQKEITQEANTEEVKELPQRDYLDKKINQQYEALTDFNVKIINSRELSEKTVYYFARKNDSEWREPGINAKLRTDARFFDLGVSTVEAMVNDLGYELGAGEEDTYIYFAGSDEEYLKLKEFCEQSYSTIKTFKIN